MFDNDKHSSFLRKFVNYERKMFYNIGPWSVCGNGGVDDKLRYDSVRKFSLESRLTNNASTKLGLLPI